MYNLTLSAHHTCYPQVDQQTKNFAPSPTMPEYLYITNVQRVFNV
jgi:hypothetical protein